MKKIYYPFKTKTMEIIRFYNNNNDEDFFNYIYDNIGSDIAIMHDLTCSILKIKGKYHIDYHGIRDRNYERVYKEKALKLFKQLKTWNDTITI